MKPSAIGGEEQTNIIRKPRRTSGAECPSRARRLCIVQRPRPVKREVRFLVEQRAMKKFLTVVFFCLPAFGQAAYSGLGLYSGPAAFGSSGGAPLTYSARTDNCVTGAEAGCVGGRTTGQAGSAMSFMYRPTDTVPFANLAPANTAATDPDFNTYMVMVTDTATAGQTSNFIMGDTGSWAAFSQDNTLLDR